MIFKPGQRVRITVRGGNAERHGLGPCPPGMEGVVTEGNHPNFFGESCRVQVESRPNPKHPGGWIVQVQYLRPILPPKEQAEQEYKELLDTLGAKQSNKEDLKREPQYEIR